MSSSYRLVIEAQKGYRSLVQGQGDKLTEQGTEMMSICKPLSSQTVTRQTFVKTLRKPENL